MTTNTRGKPRQKKATKNQEQRRVERQAKAKAKLEALKRKAASSCFCYVE